MRIKTVMNHNQNDGLLKMIRRTDPMIFRREHRLVYIVLGPYYQYRHWDFGMVTTRIRADIDAHTGQIIVIGNEGYYRL